MTDDQAPTARALPGSKPTLKHAALAITSAALLLAGCAGSDIDGPVIKVTGSYDSTVVGLVTTVQLEDGCLRSSDSVLVWSKDTTWNQDSDEVVRADGTRIPMGTEITINSYALPDLEKILGKDGAKVAEACGGVSTPTGKEPSGGLSVRVA